VRVLLVEDNDLLREVATRVLARFGHNVCPASTINQALACLANETIDVAVIDLILAGESGLDLGEHIRERWPDVRLIAVTGSLLQADGFDRVLIKPYSPDDLLGALEDS
jgi:CheY-like chemotaxis protein